MFLFPSQSSLYAARNTDDKERYELQTAHIIKTMEARAAKEQKQLRQYKAQRQK